MSKATNNTQRVTFGKAERFMGSFGPNSSTEVFLDGEGVAYIRKDQHGDYELIIPGMARQHFESPIVGERQVTDWRAGRDAAKAAAIAHFTPTEEPAQAETVEVEESAQGEPSLFSVSLRRDLYHGTTTVLVNMSSVIEFQAIGELVDSYSQAIEWLKDRGVDMPSGGGVAWLPREVAESLTEAKAEEPAKVETVRRYAAALCSNASAISEALLARSAQAETVEVEEVEVEEVEVTNAQRAYVLVLDVERDEWSVLSAHDYFWQAKEEAHKMRIPLGFKARKNNAPRGYAVRKWPANLNNWEGCGAMATLAARNRAFNGEGA